MDNNSVKIIHYCWFGPNKLSKLALKCIESWKKYLPDYEIKLWNEDNFDFNQNEFVKQAYINKKWAFVSDYARLKAISEYGGLYFDTDIEIVKDIGNILKQECFMGIEDSKLVNAAIIGASKPHNKFIDEMVKIYESHDKFDIENIYTISIPAQITKKLNEYGFDKESNNIQKLSNGVSVYPREYFYPLSYDHQNNVFTENTCAIHHFDATWASIPEKTTLFFRRHNMKFMVNIVDFFVVLKNVILSIIKDKAFWIFSLITIMFFGIFVKLEYATDTYQIFDLGFKGPFDHFMTSGRFITASFWAITFNLGIYISYLLSFGFAMLCVIFSVYKLYKIINKKIENDILSGCISVLTIINLFLIELFLFFEKGILCFSILMCIMALDFLVKFFERKTKKRFLISMFFMILAIFSYQGTIAIFVALGSVFILKYSKNVKEFIMNNLTVAALYGIPCIINYVTIKYILPNSRIAGQSNNILENIQKIINSLPNMLIDSYGILPKYLFLICIIITIILSLLVIIFNSKKISKILFNIIKLSYVYAAIFISTIMPQLMLSTESMWLVARNTYTFASIIGITLIYLCYNISSKNKFKTYIVVLIAITCLSLQYVGFQNVAREHYILNYMDGYICRQIEEEILNYEKNNNIKIENISFYEDKNPMYSYQGIETAYADVNIKAFYPDFSRVALINIKLNRKLISTNSKDLEIEKKFKENDWEFFDKNQVVFIDKTMHLCLF